MSGRESERLPEHWEVDVPDEQWPEALIAAVRIDASALSSPRAVATLRGWRSAYTTSEGPAREHARVRLSALAEALLSEAPLRPVPTERLDTIALLGPRPPMPQSNPERPTDSAVPVLAARSGMFPDATPSSKPELTAWAGQGWVPEDSADDLDPLLADLVGGLAIPRAPSIQRAGVETHDDDDTGHVDVRDDSNTHRPTSRSRADTPPRRVSAAATMGVPVAPSSRSEPPAARASVPITMPPQPPPLDEFADEPPTTAAPILGIRSTSAPPALVPQRPLPPPAPPASSVAPPAAPPSSGLASGATPPSSPASGIRGTASERRPAARAGVVRRATAPFAPQDPPRPRAALVQVRTLYAAILPLCRELVPLSPERRSRRFWTHWREASGDRGVRRDVAEQILEAARDVRGMASELIAEVQSVDADSVRILIDRINSEGLTVDSD